MPLILRLAGGPRQTRPVHRLSEPKCFGLEPWLIQVRRVTLEWEQVLVHSADPMSLGQWWAEALGWVVVHSSADEFEILTHHVGSVSEVEG
jgi:hypothetical protein